jgi:hypothetical protein
LLSSGCTLLKCLALLFVRESSEPNVSMTLYKLHGGDTTPEIHNGRSCEGSLTEVFFERDSCLLVAVKLDCYSRWSTLKVRGGLNWNRLVCELREGALGSDYRQTLLD